MPYQHGSRLPSERASKLGHLEVLQSELVQALVEQFEYAPPETGDSSGTPWEEMRITDEKPLRLIFAVDGSLQIVSSQSQPVREIAYIKTALLRLNPYAIEKLDPEYPHPLAIKKMMQDSALYHATALPLKNINIPGIKYLDAMRRIIFDSLNDPRLDAQPYQTLKWLLYRKWADKPVASPNFSCPHCGNDVPGLPADSDTSSCPSCKGELFLSDVLGLHMEMLEDSSSQGVASSYMLIHELLMLFSAIRHFWEHNKKALQDALFIKDGPLILRSQYSKVVPCIRAFFQSAKEKGIEVHLIGQEKTGAFFEHLKSIERFASPLKADEPGSYAILSHRYVRDEVQRTPNKDNEYGKRTNYGEKIYVKCTPYHSMVLSIPPGEYVEKADFPTQPSDLIGFNRIIATLPTLLSHRYEGGLLPIELANGIASLSSYPSANVLKVFSGLD